MQYNQTSHIHHLFDIVQAKNIKILKEFTGIIIFNLFECPISHNFDPRCGFGALLNRFKLERVTLGYFFTVLKRTPSPRPGILICS